MATPSYPPPAGAAVAVVGTQFCVPYPVDLTVTRKALSVTGGDFAVTDANGKVMFRVNGVLFSFWKRRVLLDAAGNPILTMQEKIPSTHIRWNVFRGDSSHQKDLLFSAEKSSLFQLKTKLNVFLGANTSEMACDFKVKGSYTGRSCTIYLGDSSTVLAQMKRKYTAKNVLLGKDTFVVTTHPNVDHAFVVALIIILGETNWGGCLL